MVRSSSSSKDSLFKEAGFKRLTSQRDAAPLVLYPKLDNMDDISTDFPAPLGPERTTRPWSNSSSTSLNVTRSRKYKRSINVYHPRRACLSVQKSNYVLFYVKVLHQSLLPVSSIHLPHASHNDPVRRSLRLLFHWVSSTQW